MGLETHTDFDYAEDAILGVAIKNTTTNLDFKIPGSTYYLNGGAIIYTNANWGDYIEAQVIDIDNVLGYGANTILKQYISKRYLHPNENYDDIDLPYAGHIPQNIYLRIIYHNTSTDTDVNLAINYFLHTLP